jgi:hypothetical protein
MRHVGQDLARLGRYRARHALAGERVDGNHARQKDELAGPDARRVRQVEIPR